MKTTFIFLVICSLQSSCRSEKETFFMRYVSPDSKRLEEIVTTKYTALNEYEDDYDIFNTSIDLAEALTILRREDEAIKLLKPYLEDPPEKAEPEDLAWLYLNFATANQYLNKNDVAEQYFKKSIAVVEDNKIDSVAHYAYHHYGRFLVERKNYELAKKYFENALTLRKRLHDANIVSTQNAIDRLAQISKKQR